MKDLTVILPLHECNEVILKYVQRALASYYATDAKNETSLLVIGPKNALSALQSSGVIIDASRVIFVENKEPDFATQVNKAVEKVTTKYFSILELDDEYTQNYFENLETYTQAYPEFFSFIPLNEVYDANNEGQDAIGYVNEAFWASSFSERLGELDEESVRDYLNINVTGAIFNTKDFIDLGGLKASMKISFWHEFLLRALHKAKRIFVIPKVGYHHYINRKDSLSDIYKNTVSEEEAAWWVNLAQEEYYYKNDRKKVY